MSNLILTAVNILAGLIVFIHCVCRLSVRRWTVKQPELWAHAALAGGASGIICSPLNVEGRADVELAWFFSAWGLALLWALACAVVRPSRMGWSVPLGAAGLVWALLPVINALTTHTHLGTTLPAGEWVWASMDLAFLATGLLLGWLSWRLRPGLAPKGKAAAAKAPRTSTAAALPTTPDVSVSTSGA